MSSPNGTEATTSGAIAGESIVDNIAARLRPVWREAAQTGGPLPSEERLAMEFGVSRAAPHFTCCRSASVDGVDGCSWAVSITSMPAFTTG